MFTFKTFKHGSINTTLGILTATAEATKDIALAQEMYEKAEVRVEIEHEVKRDFFKDTEGDRKKVLAYAEELRNVIVDSGQPKKSAAQRLPSWESIRRDEKGAKLPSFMRRRAVTSTVELLSKEGLVCL